MELKIRRPIYNQRLAGYLMLNGFVLKGIDKNEDGSNRTVFFFNDSGELSRSINEFFDMKVKLRNR